MSTRLVFALVLMLTAGTALAGNCPNQIAQIDQLLESRELSSEVESQVKSLRDEGETAHANDDHETATSKLGEALALIAQEADGVDAY